MFATNSKILMGSEVYHHYESLKQSRNVIDDCFDDSTRILNQAGSYDCDGDEY
jgi:hypothetical protein